MPAWRGSAGTRLDFRGRFGRGGEGRVERGRKGKGGYSKKKEGGPERKQGVAGEGLGLERGQIGLCWSLPSLTNISAGAHARLSFTAMFVMAVLG